MLGYQLKYSCFISAKTKCCKVQTQKHRSKLLVPSSLFTSKKKQNKKEFTKKINREVDTKNQSNEAYSFRTIHSTMCKGREIKSAT